MQVQPPNNVKGLFFCRRSRTPRPINTNTGRLSFSACRGLAYVSCGCVIVGPAPRLASDLTDEEGGVRGEGVAKGLAPPGSLLGS
jgi:hypothetical protein